MPDCENLARCPFFNDKMANMPSMSEMMKQKFCRGDKTLCARYLVCGALGKERVPADLFPNMTDRARQLIAAR